MGLLQEETKSLKRIVISWTHGSTVEGLQKCRKPFPDQPIARGRDKAISKVTADEGATTARSLIASARASLGLTEYAYGRHYGCAAGPVRSGTGPSTKMDTRTGTSHKPQNKQKV